LSTSSPTAFPDPIDERLHDAEIDVRLEQRQADLAQRRIHGRLGQPGLSPQGFEDVLKPGAERFEHVAAVTRAKQAPLERPPASAQMVILVEFTV
jgi:hypothetical protein